MSLKNRQELKSFFKAGSIPKEAEFADLIDSFINQSDEGITVSNRGNIQIGNATTEASLSLAPRWNQLSGNLTTVTVGSNAVQGHLTRFRDELTIGQDILIDGIVYQVDKVDGDESLQLKTTIQHKPEKLPINAFFRSHLLAVQDGSGKTHFYISRDGLIGVGKTPQTTFDVEGNVRATTFSGNGAALTNLPANQLKGLIPAENLPVININEISGLLTISEAYSHALLGKVSGEKGGEVVTASNDFPALLVGQRMRIGGTVYEIKDRSEKQLTVRPSLSERLDGATAYTAGDFLKMNLDGKTKLHVDALGNILSDGTVSASDFKGNGASLTDLPANQLKGLISAENLPVININEINGLLTIHGLNVAVPGFVFGEIGQPLIKGLGDFLSKGFFKGQKITVENVEYEVLAIENENSLRLTQNLKKDIIDSQVYIEGDFLQVERNGESVAKINSVGDFKTKGNVNAKSFTGDGSALTHLSAAALEGMIDAGNLPQVNISEVNGLFTIKGNVGTDFLSLNNPEGKSVLGVNPQGDLRTDGMVECAKFKGNGSELTHLSAAAIEGMIDANNLPPARISEVNGLLTIKGNAGTDFLSLKNQDGKSVLGVNPQGDLRTDGSIESAKFKGNGSALTNLSAAAIEGMIDVNNLPQVNVSEVNGLLTIKGNTETDFLSLNNPEGKSVLGINPQGDLRTDGTIESAKFKGNGSELTHLSAAAIEGMIDANNLPPARISEVNGLLTINGNTETDFLSLKNQDGKSVLGVNPQGDLRTDGSIESAKFKGNGSELTHLSAAALEGMIDANNLPPVYLAPSILLFTEKTVLFNGEEAILQWSSKGVDELKLQFLGEGRMKTLSTERKEIQFQESNFRMDLVQTTTITLFGYVSGKLVDQRQCTFTVEQNASQYASQLHYEHFSMEYVLDVLGKRYGFDVLTDRTLMLMASAMRFTPFPQAQSLVAIPFYYRESGQAWDNVVHGKILYRAFGLDLQQKISQDAMDWSQNRNVGELCVMIHDAYSLSKLTAENFTYIVTAVRDTNRYSLEECFRGIPQFYRNNGEKWLPEKHGTALEYIFSYK